MTIEDPDKNSVSRLVAAPAAALWGMISDVTRMGEWSPETKECQWIRGASGPKIGAKFRGRNVNGKYKWATTCEVTECSDGIGFAFEARSFGLRISRWEYRFEEGDDGCKVTESWTDQRGFLVKALSPRVSGVNDRAAHNESTMSDTLDRLAAVAESTG